MEVFLNCYAFEMVMESSIILNLSLIRAKCLQVMGYSLFLRLPKGESLCIGKEGNFMVMLEKAIYRLNLMF